MKLPKLKSALILLACGLCLQTNGQSMMTTIAGTGAQWSSGYSGDGGPANLAELRHPSDICMDTAYNIYIADMGNNVVRKIDAQTGIITTIAGDGTMGNSGDGGLATNAQLKTPAYICLDNTGNLYISDGATYASSSGNNNIRKVSLSTGIITTVAGTGAAGFSGDDGPANLAQISNPMEIVADADNNIYFVDEQNSRIRKIDAQTGIITTVIGGGNHFNDTTATEISLSNPHGLAISRSGVLFFSDEHGMRIKRLDPITNMVTTIAGDGWYFMEAYPAIEGKVGIIYGMYCDGHGDVYINDESCSCRRIDSLDGNIYRVAGDTVLEGYNGDSGPALTTWFNRPIGMAVHPVTGDIIVADMWNNRVRMVTQPGYISTIPELEEPQLVETVNGAILNVYPNPSSGRFAVQNTGVVTDTKLEVYNSVGATVYSGVLKDRQEIIDISEQPSGMYHIVMSCDGKKQVKKLIITK